MFDFSLYRLCIPSGGELLSALVATSLDDVSAALGLHPLSETVDLAALTLLGLECSFHIILTSQVILSCSCADAVGRYTRSRVVCRL